jgi:MinD-like ATPase involved in chromosome partitioning or flagellar assembly
MSHRVLFYSPKGGQGKTTLAANYALFTDADFYTNDYATGTKDWLAEKIGINKFHPIKNSDTELAVAKQAVFDFGGWLDGKLPAIIKTVGLCVIPVCYQSFADLRPLYITIENVSRLNDNMIVVINNTRKAYIETLYDEITRQTKGKYPIMIIKQSTFLTYLADEGKTPFEIDSLIGVAKDSLIVVQNQLHELYKYIMEH